MKKYRFIVIGLPRTKDAPGLIGGRHKGGIDRRWIVRDDDVSGELIGEDTGRYFLTEAEAQRVARLEHRSWPGYRFKVFRVERVI